VSRFVPQELKQSINVRHEQNCLRAWGLTDITETHEIVKQGKLPKQATVSVISATIDAECVVVPPANSALSDLKCCILYHVLISIRIHACMYVYVCTSGCWCVCVCVCYCKSPINISIVNHNQIIFNLPLACFGLISYY